MLGFFKRNAEANADGWVDVGSGFSFNPKEASKAEQEMLMNGPRHYCPEYMRGLDIVAVKPKPAPEPTLDVVALAKRWGIDSLADAEYLIGRITMTAYDPARGSFDWYMQLISNESQVPVILSDVIAFEARMAFAGKTAKKLLAERDKAAATK